jgi:DNA repair protein RadC
MIIRTAEDAAKLFEPAVADAKLEVLIALHLDGENRMLGMDVYPSSSPDAAEMPVREIIAAALRLGSAEIVLAHNHPSGDASPSDAELRATRRLADISRGVGIMLIDHLIYGGGEWRSLRQMGLM